MKKLILVIALVVTGTGLWGQSSAPQSFKDTANAHEGNDIWLGKLFDKEKEELQNKYVKNFPGFPDKAPYEVQMRFLKEYIDLKNRQAIILFMYLMQTENVFNVFMGMYKDKYGVSADFDTFYKLIDGSARTGLEKEFGITLPK